MKIIQPYAKLIDKGTQTHDALMRIEYGARISHRSEDQQKQESYAKFLKAVVIDHGDWSVVEHSSVAVEFYVDRGITHELVRHRLFSYTQESTRFVNYEKKMPPAFIYPKPEDTCVACLMGNAPACPADPYLPWFHILEGREDENCSYDPRWLYSIQRAEMAYKALISSGWRPQEARSVFPNALASKILMTGNLRSWRWFFLMRTSVEAHPQMRQVTIPLLAEFKQRFPILFNDIEPLARQVDNIAKGH